MYNERVLVYRRLLYFINANALYYKIACEILYYNIIKLYNTFIIF